MTATSLHIGYRSGDSAASQRLEKFSNFSSKIGSITKTFNPDSDLLSSELEVIKKDSLEKKDKREKSLSNAGINHKLIV